MAEHTYKVVREHIGDKPYAPGDTRTANPGDVAHLVPHVLEDRGPVKAKAEPEAKNKAEPKVSNKADAAAKTKDADQ